MTVDPSLTAPRDPHGIYAFAGASEVSEPEAGAPRSVVPVDLE